MRFSIQASSSHLLLAALCWLAGSPPQWAQTATTPITPPAVDTPTPAVTTDAPPAASEDINQAFKDPDMDVAQWVERFEGESREIFTCRETILDALQLQPGMRVADVGAGTGFFSRLLADRLGRQGWVYAVDISPAFMRHVAEVSRQQGIENITAVLCAEDSVNLPAESVDLVFVCDTYHHFAFPEKTLASIRQALQPGGHLVVIDFEREVGKSREWVLQHVRAGKDEFAREIIKAGFELERDMRIDGFHENYLLRFVKTPEASAGNRSGEPVP